MAPGVKQIIFAQNRWKSTVDYDWATIKKEWTSLLHQSQKKIFIEGSPPNLMRVASIQKNFEGEMKGVISISSPYMQISSAIKKKYHTKIAKKKLDLNDKIPTKLILHFRQNTMCFICDAHSHRWCISRGTNWSSSRCFLLIFR